VRDSFSVRKELPKSFDDSADLLAGHFVLSSNVRLRDTQNQHLLRNFLSFTAVPKAFGLMGKIGSQGAIELLLWDEDRPSHDPGYWLLSSRGLYAGLGETASLVRGRCDWGGRIQERSILAARVRKAFEVLN
jgi:hypothetical protein